MVTDQFQLTTQRVASFDGTDIVYDVYDAGHESFAVIVPGFWRDRIHPSMKRLADLCQRAGLNVAVIDNRGHGESGGVYGFNHEEHRDVAAVITQLRQQYSVKAIDLIGLSMGGAISISTMARHPENPWRSLLLISAVAEFNAISPKMNLFTMHRHLALRQAFRKPRFNWKFSSSAKLRAVDDVRVVDVPLCLIHVKNDWLITHSHSEAIFAAANDPKEMHLLDVPGAFHADRIFSVAAAQAESIVFDFWKRLK